MDVDESVEEVKALGRKHYEAAAAGDVETLEAMFGDDLAYLHATGRRDDKASYLDLVAAGRYRDVQTEFLPERVWLIGDCAVVLAQVASTGTMDNVEQHREGVVLDVWNHRDGRWQLFAHCMQEDSKEFHAVARHPERAR